MIDPIKIVRQFLKSYDLENSSLLLGLSGGADSLCLFYCLLACQQTSALAFQVAYVDHGWRKESQIEALQLKELAMYYHIPFHSKRLDPKMLNGNLEDACRQERYRFFREIVEIQRLQGVFVGHQADDQAETVLKRLLEGAHWSTLSALKPDTILLGVRVLRPLLSFSKKDICAWLKQQGHVPFEDYTNVDPHFLRARMRQRLIPILNQEFGKHVQSSLVYISEEMQELQEFMEERVAPLISAVRKGPFGVHLAIKQQSSYSLAELKYVIRKLCSQENFILSRPLLNQAAFFLQEGRANRVLTMGKRVLVIDRHHLFICALSQLEPLQERISLTPGCHQVGQWRIEVQETADPDSIFTSSWQEGWEGQFSVSLPKDHYDLASVSLNASYHFKNHSVSKWWTDHKVPAFFRPLIPVVWKGKTIYHEFLTGKRSKPLSSPENWVAVKMHLMYNKDV